ncbi:hypothetical protein [Bacillus toyonensis]|uniref:hypothetical protein n=1 Tax=Bacillus toyonensis TaxID=155322 RepID=UPI000BF99964|nr:hypothetical protein [Bacillus toyonensis]PGF05312.1 hypothetical protein COM61_02560 [Bacillus toyonensis]
MFGLRRNKHKIKLTKMEKSILKQIRDREENFQEEYTEEDLIKREQWINQFTELNKDCLGVGQVPLLKPICVVSESAGYFYQDGKSATLNRGSVLVRVSENMFYCIDAMQKFTTKNFVHYTPISEYLTYNEDENSYGKVKELNQVKL